MGVQLGAMMRGVLIFFTMGVLFAVWYTIWGAAYLHPTKTAPWPDPYHNLPSVNKHNNKDNVATSTGERPKSNYDWTNAEEMAKEIDKRYNSKDKKLKVFFILAPYEAPMRSWYSHAVVSLGEGLLDLLGRERVVLHSNVDSWRENVTSEWLFNKWSTVSHRVSDFEFCNQLKGYDAVVVSSQYYHGWGTMNYVPEIESCIPLELKYPSKDHPPCGLNRGTRKKGERWPITFSIDLFDGNSEWAKGYAPRFDVYMRSHFTVLPLPPSAIPVAYGVTNRLLKIFTEYLPPKPFEERKTYSLVAHRVGHSVRSFFQSQVWASKSWKTRYVNYNDNFKTNKETLWDQLMWNQTGRRHSMQFYSTLADSKLCDGSGGFEISAPANPPAGFTIYQYDSFKLWEIWTSGCVVVTMDFDKHGMILPVQPVNFKHYIGFTKNREEIESIIQRINSGEIDLAAISRDGRQWAIDNYAPVPVAKRWLVELWNHQEKMIKWPM